MSVSSTARLLWAARTCDVKPQLPQRICHVWHRKETHCEFCDGRLPDWKSALTPRCGANAPAVMNVNFDGRTYSFEVKPGPDGYRQFTEAIRRAFSLPEDSELNITFTCDEPTTGMERAQPPPPPPPPAAPVCEHLHMITFQHQICKSWAAYSLQSSCLLVQIHHALNSSCVPCSSSQSSAREA